MVHSRLFRSHLGCHWQHYRMQSQFQFNCIPFQKTIIRSCIFAMDWYDSTSLSPLLRVTSSRHSKQNILRSFYENQNSIYMDKYQYEDLSQVNYATSGISLLVDCKILLGTETNTEIDDLYTDSINVLLPDYLLSELNNQYSVPFLIRVWKGRHL